MNSTTYYKWREISKIPSSPGVYAWYYSPEITDFDLNKTIDEIQYYKNNGNQELALKAATDFIAKYIFKYFREDAYHVVIYGSLKPKYEGYIQHKPELSRELLRRIVENPKRLITLKQILENSAPNFASPLYIGMSENLNDRLKRHKRLIEKCYSDSGNSNNEVESIFDTSNCEQDFARRIYSRNIPPTRLFVMVNIMENIGKQYLDLENILNRIHYPLLGRN